jgi:hypothetical protein
VTTHTAPCRWKTYTQQDAAQGPKGISVALLSPPQCSAAFGMMPHTLVQLTRVLFAVLGCYPPVTRTPSIGFWRGVATHLFLYTTFCTILSLNTAISKLDFPHFQMTFKFLETYKCSARNTMWLSHKYMHK